MGIGLKAKIREADDEILSYYPDAQEGDIIDFPDSILGLRKVREGKAEFIEMTDTPEEGEYSAKQIEPETLHNGYYAFAEEYIQKNPIYYDPLGYWWVWRPKEYKYIKRDEIHIMILIENSLRHAKKIIGTTDPETIRRYNTLAPTIKTQLLEALKRTSRKKQPESLEWHYIQFKDKIYNLKNGQYFDATSKYFITNPIPWSVGKKPDTPQIDKLFKEWCGDQQILLEELTAYCTVPGQFMSRIFWLYGEGSNGKSQYLRLLEKFVGGENTTNVTDISLLVNNQFQSSRLYKKLVCAIGEIDGKKIDKTSILKSISGGDKIGLELKGKDLFESYLYAKIIIGANILPESTDTSRGWYRRTLVIDFPNIFKGEKDVLGEIPSWEYENLAHKTLLILQRLIKTREFTGEGDFLEKRERYEARSNPLKKFYELYIEESRDGYIIGSEFYDSFNSFCEKNGYRSIDIRVLGRRLKNDFGVEKSHPTILGERRWVYNGIVWKQKKNLSEQIISLLEENKEMELSSLQSILGIAAEELLGVLEQLSKVGDVFEVRSGRWQLLK